MSLNSADWKSIVTSIAPGLATVFAGPLAGAGVKILADAVLGKSSSDQAQNEADLAKALAGGVTPEQQARILEAQVTLQTAIIAADIRKIEIEADSEKSVLLDVADARAHNANTTGVLRLGYLVNLLSYLLVGAIIYGCYLILTGVNLKQIEPSILVSISTLIGGIVQWVMSNAGQANSFFFGSSPGARANAAQLATSVADTAKTMVKKGKV